jgi:hypothetical protein
MPVDGFNEERRGNNGKRRGLVNDGHEKTKENKKYTNK